MKLAPWEVAQEQGLAAIHKRTSAEKDIVRLALLLEKGPKNRDLWTAFMTAVRSYSQADKDLLAAQAKLSG